MNRGEHGAPPSALGVDYRAVFQSLPSMIALLSPDLVFLDANDAYERISGRRRKDLIGHFVFDLFPDNPNDSEAAGVRDLAASLRRVLSTGRAETMALQRYDVRSTEPPYEWQQRYWSTINIPILDNGRVVLLVHRVEEVTELVRARSGGGAQGDQTGFLEADVYNRSQELKEAIEHLRQAHAHERVVALALQEAMLPGSPLADGQRAAVRYRPAVNTLNVCGDWYDLIELPDGNLVVAVGDVAGHGLIAAGVMGQLRSALSAAARVSSPARTLEALGLYSRSIPRAESSTAVCVCIDWSTGRLTYSSAGHLPPALLHGDGTVTFLDKATDPPLGASPKHETRPEAQQGFTIGDILVLYTDGLVERRREDIDVSLGRLAESLTAHRALAPEQLADALLLDLLPGAGATDDTALVVVRL